MEYLYGNIVKKLSLGFFTLFFLGTLIPPICMLVGLALDEATGHGFALSAFQIQAALYTVGQALVSSLLANLLGIILAVILFTYEFQGKNMIVQLCLLPFVLPSVVVGFLVIFTFGRSGALSYWMPWFGSIGSWVYSPYSLIFVHVFYNTGFCLNHYYRRLLGCPESQIKRACLLHVNGWLLWKVLLWPRLKASCFYLSRLVFFLSLTSFGLALILSGQSTLTTLEVLIYQSLKVDFRVDQALLLALTQFCILAVVGGLWGSFVSTVHPTLSSSIVKKREFRVSWGANFYLKSFSIGVALFFSAVVVIILGSFVGKAVVIILEKRVFDPDFLHALLAASLRTLIYAVCSSILSLILCMVFSIGARLSAKTLFIQKRAVQSILFCSPVFLSLGYSMLLYHSDSSLIRFFMSAVAVNSLFMLPFIYPYFQEHWNEMEFMFEKRSQSIGLNYILFVTEIVVPACRPIVLLTFAVSLSMSIGEFTVISMFATEVGSTLSVLVYQLMGAYRFEQAIIVMLVMMVIALFVQWWVEGIKNKIKGET